MPGRSGRISRLTGEDDIVDDEPMDYDRPLTVEEKIRQKRDEIDDDLDDTAAMVNQAIDTGNATNQSLAAQNEQLRRAKRLVGEQKEDLSKADHHISRMEMCCCFAVCCWCFHPKEKKVAMYEDTTAHAKTSRVARKQGDRLDEDEEGIDEEERARRREANKLDEISEGLDAIQQIALNQREHIKETGNIVTDLNPDIDNVRDQIRHNDARAKGLL